MKDAGGGFIGEETYKRFVRANGYTVRDFEESMRRQILLIKLNAIFSASLLVSDAEVERSYRDQAERAAMRYAVLPLAGFQSQATLSSAELAGYFERHAEEFRLPPQRVVNYLLVDTVRTRANMTLEKAELESYYNEHLDDWKQEEQVHARHILLKVDDNRTAEAAEASLEAARKRIEAGEDFAKLATELSDDPGSKSRGGDLGFFGRGRMIKEFEQAAFEASAGTMVGPIHTSFGLHLIQVLEKRAAGQRPFTEVEAQVRSRLAAERAETQAEAKSTELATRISAEGLKTEEQLKALADNDAVMFITTPPFGIEEVVAGVGRGTPFSSAAFALEPGGVSAPVKIPRGFAILSPVSESPARLPALSEVEARVRPAALRAKTGELALARLDSGARRARFWQKLRWTSPRSSPRRSRRAASSAAKAGSKASPIRANSSPPRSRVKSATSERRYLPTRARCSSRSPPARASIPPLSPPSATRRGRRSSATKSIAFWGRSSSRGSAKRTCSTTNRCSSSSTCSATRRRAPRPYFSPAFAGDATSPGAAG